MMELELVPVGRPTDDLVAPEFYDLVAWDVELNFEARVSRVPRELAVHLMRVHREWVHRQAVNAALTVEELELAAAGRYISVIKSVRERLGLGLREAKAFVDCYREKNPGDFPPPPPPLLPAPV